MSPRLLAMLLTTATCFTVAPITSLAQNRIEIASQADILLRSASNDALDSLFQSVHAISTSPTDSTKVCRALASPDRGSADTWLALAQELSGDNRDRLTSALGEVALSGWQGRPSAFDEKAARTSLRQAGVRAAMLNDGFSASALSVDDVNATNEAEMEALRCRSLGWLLDAVASQPLDERAAITRLLLRDGLASILQKSADKSVSENRQGYWPTTCAIQSCRL